VQELSWTRSYLIDLVKRVKFSLNVFCVCFLVGAAVGAIWFGLTVGFSFVSWILNWAASWAQILWLGRWW